MTYLNLRAIIFVPIILLALVGLCGCKKEATVVTEPYSQDEFLVREGQVGSENFRFRVYVPPGRKVDEKLPVMLYLHGAGNRGNDNESQLNGLAEIIRTNRDRFSFIVVIPQCEADKFWDANALIEANAALDDVVKELNGDSDRLYLAGFSLGGYGAWTMAAMFPNKFAAVVPMSGRVLPRPREITDLSPEIVELAKSSEPFERFAEKIGRVPLWIFHGTADKVVPIDGSRQMIRAILKAGNANVKFSEVEGAGHEPLGFKDPELFTWLAKQNRNKGEDGST